MSQIWWSLSLFKQQMNLYFTVHNIRNWIQYIGLPRLQIYNSWTLSESDNTIENEWYKLEDHIQPHSNQWLARLHLQQTRQIPEAPNDTAYKRWSCHSGLKLLCKLCRTSPPPALGARFTDFGHAGHADPLDGWRCCSQKQVMSRPIQVRQL